MGAYVDFDRLVRLLRKMYTKFNSITQSVKGLRSTAITGIKFAGQPSGNPMGSEVTHADGSKEYDTMTIPLATTEKCGMLDPADKQKLDTLTAYGLPEIALEDLDLDFSGNAYFEYTQGKRPLQYKVTSMGFVAGLMELLPDELGHVLVQKITGQFTLSGGNSFSLGNVTYCLDGTSLSGHQDGKCCSYYRVFNFSSPYLDEETFPKMQWSKWMNEPYYNLLPFLLQPADSLKLSELTRPAQGTIAMKKLRTQYLAFATDGTNEIGGLYIEDAHTMIQAKQGTPIKLGWRGGNVGFCMDSNGHAGIGYATGGNLPTIDTSARLTVDGNLRVLGKVIADTPTPPTATKIEPGTDLNTLTTPGWYYYDNIEAAYATLAHTPPSQATCHFLMLVTPSCRESETYANQYKTAIFLPSATLGNLTRSYFFIRRGLTNKWNKVDLSTLFTTEEWES